MAITQRRITEPASLKALAHPVRIEILEALAVGGAMTATEVAAVIGHSPSNCSWHLRKLADHGFVRAVDGSQGRQRPWQVVAEGLSWGDDDGPSPPAMAGTALSDLFVHREVQRLRAAHASAHLESVEWRHVANETASLLYLTAEEAAELAAAIRDLIMAKADSHGHIATRPPGARLVSAVAWVTPAGPPDPRDLP